MRRLRTIFVTVALLMVTLPAVASIWGGENGVVRLSIAQGEDLVATTNLEPGPGGATTVDLYAYLDEVEPMQHDGEAFLAIGGFELKLLIEGAEGQILEQKFPFAHFNVGRDPGQCVVGIDPSQRLVDGRCELARWKILFTGPVENVTFRLDPEALTSCGTVEGCPGTGTQALYSGTVDAGLMAYLVGAGCVPAHLNWEEAPPVEPIRGTAGWREVGVFAPRD